MLINSLQMLVPKWGDNIVYPLFVLAATYVYL